MKGKRFFYIVSVITVCILALCPFSEADAIVDLNGKRFVQYANITITNEKSDFRSNGFIPSAADYVIVDDTYIQRSVDKQYKPYIHFLSDTEAEIMSNWNSFVFTSMYYYTLDGDIIRLQSQTNAESEDSGYPNSYNFLIHDDKNLIFLGSTEKCLHNPQCPYNDYSSSGYERCYAHKLGAKTDYGAVFKLDDSVKAPLKTKPTPIPAAQEHPPTQIAPKPTPILVAPPPEQKYDSTDTPELYCDYEGAFAVDSEGGETPKITVTSSHTWHASSDADWISVSKKKGENGKTLVVNVKKNKDIQSREGKVKLSSAGCDDVYINVTQAGQQCEARIISVKPQDGAPYLVGEELKIDVQTENAKSIGIYTPETDEYDSFNVKKNGALTLELFAFAPETIRYVFYPIDKNGVKGEGVDFEMVISGRDEVFQAPQFTGKNIKDGWITVDDWTDSLKVKWKYGKAHRGQAALYGILNGEQTLLDLSKCSDPFMALGSSASYSIKKIDANTKYDSYRLDVYIAAKGWQAGKNSINFKVTEKRPSINTRLIPQNYTDEAVSISIECRIADVDSASDILLYANKKPIETHVNDDGSITGEYVVEKNTDVTIKLTYQRNGKSFSDSKEIEVNNIVKKLNVSKADDISCDHEGLTSRAIKVNSTYDWTVSSNVDWITFSATSGDNRSSFKPIIAPNTNSDARVGVISVNSKGCAAVGITVRQSGDPTVIAPEPSYVGATVTTQDQRSTDVGAYAITLRGSFAPGFDETMDQYKVFFEFKTKTADRFRHTSDMEADEAFSYELQASAWELAADHPYEYRAVARRVSDGMVITGETREFTLSGDSTDQARTGLDGLEIIYVDGDSVQSVSHNVTLPEKTSFGDNVEWISWNHNLITNGGELVRPVREAADAMLTAIVHSITGTPFERDFKLHINKTIPKVEFEINDQEGYLDQPVSFTLKLTNANRVGFIAEGNEYFTFDAPEGESEWSYAFNQAGKRKINMVAYCDELKGEIDPEAEKTFTVNYLKWTGEVMSDTLRLKFTAVGTPSPTTGYRLVVVDADAEAENRIIHDEKTAVNAIEPDTTQKLFRIVNPLGGVPGLNLERTKKYKFYILPENKTFSDDLEPALEAVMPLYARPLTGVFADGDDKPLAQNAVIPTGKGVTVKYEMSAGADKLTLKIGNLNEKTFNDSGSVTLSPEEIAKAANADETLIVESTVWAGTASGLSPISERWTGIVDTTQDSKELPPEELVKAEPPQTEDKEHIKFVLAASNDFETWEEITEGYTMDIVALDPQQIVDFELFTRENDVIMKKSVGNYSFSEDGFKWNIVKTGGGNGTYMMDNYCVLHSDCVGGASYRIELLWNGNGQAEKLLTFNVKFSKDNTPITADRFEIICLNIFEEYASEPSAKNGGLWLKPSWWADETKLPVLTIYDSKYERFYDIESLKRIINPVKMYVDKNGGKGSVWFDDKTGVISHRSVGRVHIMLEVAGVVQNDSLMVYCAHPVDTADVIAFDAREGKNIRLRIKRSKENPYQLNIEFLNVPREAQNDMWTMGLMIRYTNTGEIRNIPLYSWSEYESIDDKIIKAEFAMTDSVVINGYVVANYNTDLYACGKAYIHSTYAMQYYNEQSSLIRKAKNDNKTDYTYFGLGEKITYKNDRAIEDEIDEMSEATMNDLDIRYRFRDAVDSAINLAGELVEYVNSDDHGFWNTLDIAYKLYGYPKSVQKKIAGGLVSLVLDVDGETSNILLSGTDVLLSIKKNPTSFVIKYGIKGVEMSVAGVAIAMTGGQLFLVDEDGNILLNLENGLTDENLVKVRKLYRAGKAVISINSSAFGLPGLTKIVENALDALD